MQKDPEMWFTLYTISYLYMFIIIENDSIKWISRHFRVYCYKIKFNNILKIIIKYRTKHE